MTRFFSKYKALLLISEFASFQNLLQNYAASPVTQQNLKAIQTRYTGEYLHHLIFSLKFAMGRGKNTTDAERLAIIHWLKSSSNFDLIVGNAAKGPVVAGAKLKKTDAYQDLAQTVNRACGSEWTKAIAKSRYEAYYKLYKETKWKSTRTGFGVTEEDRQVGINTVEDKLNHECRFYDEMDALFGERRNLVPGNIRQTFIRNPDLQDIRQEISPMSSENDVVAEQTSSSSASSPRAQAHDDPAFDPPVTPRTAPSPKLAQNNRPGLNQRSSKRDFSTVFLESQESAQELKKRALELEKEKVLQDKLFKEEELQIKKEELRMKEEENMKDRKEETKRMLMKTLIEQGKSADEVKQYLNIMLDI